MPILEQPYPRPPSGAPVDHLPGARVPSRAPLRGRQVELVAQDASRHAADLYTAGRESEEALQTWQYLACGPWQSLADYRATMRAQSATFDTIFHALRPHDSTRFLGQGRARRSLFEMMSVRQPGRRGVSGDD